MNENTVEIWRGESLIDGAPIVVLMTGIKTSTNGKTGPMLQTHILRSDMSPTEAQKNGFDVSICGACQNRHANGGACYVVVAHGPLGVWKSWSNGNVRRVAGSELDRIVRGRKVRLGAYGDPAAVPHEVWTNLLEHAEGWTGYTHQWKVERLRGALRYCQISADNAEEAEHAFASGAGSFRVLAEGEFPLDFETLCPADGNITCMDCMMCDGVSGNNIAIPVHGSFKSRFESKPTSGRTLPVLN